jgi:CubicO group peptidase (beta-lactamase class C family)
VATADPTRLARVDSVFARYDRNDAPGYAVGIVQNGRVIYARGFGSANLDYRAAITPATVFNVASLSKQFTAACIAILIRRGKLSLEDDVRRYVPEMPQYPHTIRLKHLIYMTSGLPEYYTLPRPGGRTWDVDQFTVDDAIRATFAAGNLQFTPGTRWAYSNINYMLLADIVRRVSGVSFAEFARREIFEPLAMTNSHINDDLGRVVPNRATGYNLRSPGIYQQELRRSPHFGGSGLFTSVEDLVKWDRNFSTHKLGGPELTALMLSTMKFDHAKANDAFGLVWGNHKGNRTIWYEGGDLGYSSYMVRLPDAGLTVVVLSNNGNGRALDHARRVLDIFLE